MVTYNGPAGLGTAVLAGNDSTYDINGAYSYAAAVIGLAGAGATAGSGGIANGVQGYTDNGAGNGVIGLNTNQVDGAGTEVLGLASGSGSYGVSGQNSVGTGVLGSSNGANAYGVSGQNTAGTGVMGQASSPDNFAAGVFGHHTGSAGGVGVLGQQDGAGWGGYFKSAQGTAIVAEAGVMGAMISTGSTADQAFAVYGQLATTNAGNMSAAVRGENLGTSSDGVGIWGSQAGGGSGGYFTSESGNGVVANGATGVTASGSSQGVYGSSSNDSDYASAIQGELTATKSGMDGAGVYGKNDAANAQGCGVKGTHAGAGTGGYFVSTSGDGMSGKSTGAGAGVRGASLGGRGGILSGTQAQLQLVPSSAKSHPPSGQAGDLFFDAGHRLWVCLGQKSWKRLA